MPVPVEVEELIDGARLSAHLATSADDRPHVAPVWYVYDDATLSILTGGKKLRNLRRNPRVAVSIERYDEEGVAWAVQLLGTARVVEDEERYEEVAERLQAKYVGTYGTDADDGGTNAGDDEAEREDESAGDEGSEDGETEDETGALVEIEVGSAAGQRYRPNSR